jgi:TPR repeat protein
MTVRRAGVGFTLAVILLAAFVPPAAAEDQHAQDMKVLDRWAQRLTPPPPAEVLDRLEAWVRDHPDDGPATLRLAAVYTRRAGGRQDEAKAQALLRRAAETGLPEARSTLAGLTLAGTKDAAERARALETLQQCAAAGDVSGMVVLGEACAQGRGVPQDREKAKDWLAKAAAAGSLRALLDLSGLQDSKQQAFEMLGSAAEAGEPLAQKQLAQLYLSGTAPAPRDPEKGREWLAKSAANGNADAAVMLAEMYEFGRGAPVDPRKALELYDTAAGWGQSFAEQALFEAYASGRLGVAVDAGKALEWLRRSATHVNPSAQLFMGLVCAGGFGVPRDAGEAKKWLERLRPGDPRGEVGVNLLKLLDPAQRESADARQFLASVRQRADGGDANAQAVVGVLIASGVVLTAGGDASAEARRWLDKSAAGGSPVGKALATLAGRQAGPAPAAADDKPDSNGSTGAAPSGRSATPGSGSGG